MKHNSIPISPKEFVNIVPLNPLLSKCQIKVMYVGDEPNRNKSIITKATAEKMANSLPGSPIVGKFNEDTKDFEGHNEILKIEEKSISLVPDTFPYGFIPTDAKVWFQKFIDDGINEREYMMTEGVLWTGQFPEAQRIIDKGNNHSMELSDDKRYLDAHWTKDKNGKPQFFIINDAVFSKLCVLGEEREPCFEGSQIGKLDFNLGEEFKSTFFSMIEQFKNLYEGGSEMEQDTNVILEDNLVEDATNNIEDTVEDVVENVEDSVEDVVENVEDVVENGIENPVEDIVEQPLEATYSLDEIPEYNELQEKYNSLETNFNLVQTELEDLKTNYAVLKKFKKEVDDLEKDELIKSFYMLSDDDKKSVIKMKDTYSLEEIESKLSVMCVRNKVNFNLEEDDNANTTYTYNLDGLNVDSNIPAWVKAVERTASKNQY